MIVDDTAAEPVVSQREQQLADMIEDGDENAVGDIILEGYRIGKDVGNGQIVEV